MMSDNHIAGMFEVAGIAYSAKTVNSLRDAVKKVILDAARDAHDAGIKDAFETSTAVTREVDKFLTVVVATMTADAAKLKQQLDLHTAA